MHNTKRNQQNLEYLLRYTLSNQIQSRTKEEKAIKKAYTDALCPASAEFLLRQAPTRVNFYPNYDGDQATTPFVQRSRKIESRTVSLLLFCLFGCTIGYVLGYCETPLQRMSAIECETKRGFRTRKAPSYDIYANDPDLFSFILSNFLSRYLDSRLFILWPYPRSHEDAGKCPCGCGAKFSPHADPVLTCPTWEGWIITTFSFFLNYVGLVSYNPFSS